MKIYTRRVNAKIVNLFMLSKGTFYIREIESKVSLIKTEKNCEFHVETIVLNE